MQDYSEKPTAQSKTELKQGFDQVFGRCYLHHGALNQVLTGFREQKAELLVQMGGSNLSVSHQFYTL